MINANSKIAKQFWETGKLPCPILDFHAHMDEHPAIYFPAPSADDMMRSMNNFNIRWLLFSNHLSLDDPIYGEPYNVENVKKYPDRMRAYHLILPRHLDCDKIISDLEANKEYYVGCKILGDYSAFPIDDPSIFPVYQYLNDNKLFLLIHTWGGSQNNDSRHVANIAKNFPDITIIAGHTFFGRQKEGVELCLQYPNVYFELTAIPIVNGYLEDIVNTAGGSERILFGTDLPWFSTMHGVGMVLSADITDEDRLNIFYRNGDKLLSRFPWYKLD